MSHRQQSHHAGTCHMPDYSEQIEQLIESPKQASDDAGSVTSRDVRELIEAEKHLEGKEASKKPHRGIYFTKLVPPGA